MRYIIVWFQLNGYTVVWVDIAYTAFPELNLYIDQLNEIILDVTIEYEIAMYGMNLLQERVPYVLEADGFHFEQASTESQADGFIKWITERRR